MVGAANDVMPRSAASWLLTVRSAIGSTCRRVDDRRHGGAGVTEAGARRHPHLVRHADQLRRRPGERGSRGSHPHVGGDGRRARSDRAARRTRRRSTTTPLEFDCSTRATAPCASASATDCSTKSTSTGSSRPLTFTTATNPPSTAAPGTAVVVVVASWAPAVATGPTAPSTRSSRPSAPRAAPVLGSLRTTCLRGEHGPCAVLRSITGAHRGREGRRGQKHGDRRPGGRGRPRRPLDPDRGGRGQERAGARCSGGRRSATTRWCCRPEADPTVRPTSGPGPSPPTTPSSSTSRTTG